MTNSNGPRRWCLRKTALVINHQPVGRFTDQIEVIEMSAYESLQAELAEVKKWNQQQRKYFDENVELKAKAEKLVGALKHYACSTLSDEDGLHKEATEALTKVAREALKDWQS